MASSEDVSGHTTSVSILGGNIFSAYCTLNIVKHGVHACSQHRQTRRTRLLMCGSLQ